MSNQIYDQYNRRLQLKRGGDVYPSREDAFSVITSQTISLANGEPILISYSDTSAPNGVATVLVVKANDRVYFIDQQEIIDRLGSGVTTATTVTAQLKTLSGTTADTSGSTSIVGAKKYTDNKVTETINGLDADKSGTSASGHVTVRVKEEDGKITLVSVSDDDIASKDLLEELSGKTVTAVDMTGGTASIAANTADGTKKITINTDGSQVKATNYSKASAAAAIVGTDSINSALGKLEWKADNNDTRLGTGVTTSNTATDQLKVLSGTTADTSGSTSIVGAKKYTDAKVTNALDDLDADKSSSTTHISVSVKQVNGLITEVGLTENDIASKSALDDAIGTTADTSGTTSIVGAKKYTDVKVANALDGLDSDKSSSTTHVGVSVKQVDGLITEVGLTENDIASKSALDELSGKSITQADDSNTIDFTVSNANDGTKKLTASVKRSAKVVTASNNKTITNMISEESDGVFAGISYNELTNSLLISNGSGQTYTSITLNSGQMLDFIEYSMTGETWNLTAKTGDASATWASGGTTANVPAENFIVVYHNQNISTSYKYTLVPVANLLTEYTYPNQTQTVYGTDGNVEFKVTRNESGQSEIRADIKIIDCGEY